MIYHATISNLGTGSERHIASCCVDILIAGIEAFTGSLGPKQRAAIRQTTTDEDDVHTYGGYFDDTEVAVWAEDEERETPNVLPENDPRGLSTELSKLYDPD